MADNNQIYKEVVEVRNDIKGLNRDIGKLVSMKTQVDHIDKTVNKHDKFINKIMGVIYLISSGVVVACVKYYLDIKG